MCVSVSQCINHPVRYVCQVSHSVHVSVCLSVHPHIHSTLFFFVCVGFFMCIKDSLTHSFNIRFVFGGLCEVWDGVFFCFERTAELLIVLEESGGLVKELFRCELSL